MASDLSFPASFAWACERGEEDKGEERKGE